MQNPSTYQRLGAYDISVGRDGRGFQAHGCHGRTAAEPLCHGEVLDRLLPPPRAVAVYARARRRQAGPAFLRSHHGGLRPILQSPQHAGRNFGEQTLGYKFLLVSEFEKRLREWAWRRTAATGPDTTSGILRRRSRIQRRQTIHANVTGAGASVSIDYGLR